VDKPVDSVEKFCFSTDCSGFSKGFSFPEFLLFTTGYPKITPRFCVTETESGNRFQFVFAEFVFFFPGKVLFCLHPFSMPEFFCRKQTNRYQVSSGGKWKYW